jgi:hypothetical protein
MRVAGGPWTALPALDGVYDTGSEQFSSVVGPFAPGNYLVEWQAWNSNGLWTTTPASAVLEVAPSGLAGGLDGGATGGAPSLRAGPNPGRGPFTFTLTGRPGARGAARLYDAAGRLVWTSPVDVPASGRVERVCHAVTRDGGPAASGLYFLTVDLDGARLTRRLVLLR